MIKRAIYSILTSNEAVTAIVGTKVFADHVPQQYSLPAITTHRVGTLRRYSHSGQDDLKLVRAEVWSWQINNQAAETLAEAVRLALNLITGIFSNIDVRRIFLADDTEDAEQIDRGGQGYAWGVAHQYDVWAKEATS